MDWDTYFINEAHLAALKSKDRKRQVGAVIVGQDHAIRSKGYNGPPRGIDDNDPAIHVKPLKLNVFECAERNAIFNAARIGVSCLGCSIYVTHPCCAPCARGIVQSGIQEVVVHAAAPEMPSWHESQETARRIFAECGVVYRRWACEVVVGRPLPS
ncbi:deoxycytidylate deaminase [Sabulicella glaciei]|uniref:Deaminase n=1 Tax=Sabulicella glaciei TaxID=2984948 RepID=A0ABT3NTX2_9PROT|nr:deaminase [Roseococcus sp. MDT2-1-1]MCW8085594.1 deaminase [Roseococcus sp. MDT2-1-1]